MDILLLTAYFPPDVGGASHLFYELGQAFVRRGHQVHVVTGLPGYHPQGDLERYRKRCWLRETMAGMDLARIAVPQILPDTPIGRGIWQFSGAAALALAGLRVPRADIVLVYSPPLPLGLTALAWRGLKGNPFVLYVQDLFPQSAIDLGLLRQRHLIRLFETLERVLYQRADAVVVHSPGNRTHVLARGARDATTHVVRNSVDTDRIRPGPRQNSLRQELGLNDCFVVSFAGVMGHSQDLDMVLDAASILQDRDEIRFLLVGDGVERERLVRRGREMALDNVIWLPMQSRERYPAILQASDVSLTTLRVEVRTPVVPSKIMNIMAAGRPVVAALDLQGDAPRLIAEAEAGFCLAPGQPQPLADAILRLYRDPALGQRLGENGRRYAENHLSHEVSAGCFEELFAEVVAQRKQRR